jgi:hypothetical protein
VIKNLMTLSQPAEFAMPASGTPLHVSYAFDVKGAVSAAAGDAKRRIDTTGVCGDSPITTVAVLEGAFPGTSAWSPPI